MRELIRDMMSVFFWKESLMKPERNNKCVNANDVIYTCTNSLSPHRIV